MIKTKQKVAIANTKLKLLKLLSSNNNALCDGSKIFQHLTLETWNLRIFLAKCDEIHRFRWIRFNMPQGFLRFSRQLT